MVIVVIVVEEVIVGIGQSQQCWEYLVNNYLYTFVSLIIHEYYC